MRRICLLAATIVALCVLIAAPSLAFAFDEPHSQPETTTTGINHGAIGADCETCHRPDVADPSGNEGCISCHYSMGPTGVPGVEYGKGPHGVYSTVSDRCDACHDVHDAAGGTKLLPGDTVTSSCYSCHDGTGGRGVYGTIYARTGIQPGQMHRIDTTNTVPGGDAATGDSATMAFRGLNGTLGCDDCHSPHDSSTVASFTIERERTQLYDIVRPDGVKTTRLLRRNPGGSTATATVYGSGWCLACHKGRSSSGALHNHPVDTTFSYDALPILASDAMTSATATGTVARSNRAYLMPYPRTARQAGHGPICQQCHEDSRFVGTLNASGTAGDAATFTVTTSDGRVTSDNPRFQDFPHETVNQHFLVETNDDLCINCHPPMALP